MFLDTLLKRNNVKIFVLVHRKPAHANHHWHCNFRCQRNCRETVASTLFNRVYSIITNTKKTSIKIERK